MSRKKVKERWNSRQDGKSNLDPMKLEEENRKIKWLRIQVDLTRAILYQDRDLDLEASRTMVLELRRRVLDKFPGQEETFDLILLPRFDRILRERWGQGLAEEGPFN